MKRTIAFLLALLLCLSVFPAGVLAEETEEPAVSGSCGKKLSWSYDAETATLTIEGSGKMKDYEELDETTSAPWAAFPVASIQIEKGVTAVGAYAFAHCPAAEVSIAGSVTAIGDYAFAWCAALREVKLPEDLTSIGKSAFFGCESLPSIHIPAHVSYIGKAAFSDCRAMTEITVSRNNYKFRSVSGVLFSRDRSNLINYPAGRGESYSIPSGVHTVRGYAFYGAKDLCEISVPLSVTSIGRYAFGACPNLSDVYYAGSRNQWKRIKIHTDDNYGVDALLTAAVHHNS